MNNAKHIRCGINDKCCFGVAIGLRHAEIGILFFSIVITYPRRIRPVLKLEWR